MLFTYAGGQRPLLCSGGKSVGPGAPLDGGARWEVPPGTYTACRGPAPKSEPFEVAAGRTTRVSCAPGAAGGVYRCAVE